MLDRLLTISVLGDTDKPAETNWAFTGSLAYLLRAEDRHEIAASIQATLKRATEREAAIVAAQ